MSKLMNIELPEGIMKASVEPKGHVKFELDEKPKPRDPSPAPHPSKVTAPPPALPFGMKDEVELLRAGVMNKHGNHLKTQGAGDKK